MLAGTATELKEASSSDSSLSRCAPLRTGILNKLSFDRRYEELSSHGLINCTDTKAFVRFYLKLTCRTIFRQ